MPANYVLLAEQTISSTQTVPSITFSNIPQTGYTDLVLKISARVNFAGDWVGLLGQFNSSSSNYFYRRLYAYSGNTVAADSAATFGMGTGTSTPTGTFGSTDLYIPNYNSTSINKSFNIDGTSVDDSASMLQMLASGLWADSSAITSITITNDVNANFIDGSSFCLYGVAALGTSPVIAPKATGGDIVVNDGTYWYHAFNSSGVFTPNQAINCDYLVVAGGGGAGGYGGPGGGAGGFRTATNQALTATQYFVTIGAGGSGATGQPAGSNGSNSIFSNITSAGGGGTGYNAVNAGGSGGGGFVANSGAGGAGNTPSTSPSQGNNGGSAVNSAPNYGTGGGGGAGAVGANGTSTTGGNGGIGSFSAISGGSTTAVGQLSSGNYYFAGGGAGATTFGGTGGTGGLGGGGNAGAGGGNNNGSSSPANTGGGGGGGSYQSASTSAGGSGGSGIVVVRYTMA